ncbi:hypothetical protein THASP1DRAFT_33712 [Thamnocephalis sphaerospora]|uniref:NADH:flavin oxidoreductase/NADH oxidase N-terminal domain-containing protein n=1 Tax=Thamnocephalis sphaerospora TaxID=78915 RepID=A0A4P9XFW9_9FUNG|nr:hypothetical protein THASP1DRAFT_33712 [Thamnocephalis sphaerospora]|eukprot:RKP04515.1 hypothetical protein THASP1DRAFT_33712 [Thamnocephalis sphaerospora]
MTVRDQLQDTPSNAGGSAGNSSDCTSTVLPVDVDALFRPLRLGNWQLQHRIVLAPMTRRRCVNSIPPPFVGDYYAQRATPGGLLITEAVSVSASGDGEPVTPGIWSDEQTEAWRQVVQTVRSRVPDVVLVMQLWHKGRCCHSDFLPGNQLPVAPSPIANTYRTVANSQGVMVPYETPKELTVDEISTIVGDFRRASHNAKLAGFDGVEIHGANGYLVDQFLETSTNMRTDAYGGTVENRIRFCAEVTRAAIDAFGPGFVGIRFSPFGQFNGMHDEDPVRLFTAAIRKVTQLGVAYVHLVWFIHCKA